jgi:hypothetical protein
MIKREIKITLIFLILLFLISEKHFTQGKNNYNPGTYESEFDSLLIAKKQNDFSKQNLIDEITELKKISSDLSEKIRLATLEIEKLYTDRFGKDTGVRIYNKQIWKGMTEKMLQASWGKPDKIDKNIEKWGSFTQWYYGKITFFFRDNKLTDWEEKK